MSQNSVFSFTQPVALTQTVPGITQSGVSENQILEDRIRSKIREVLNYGIEPFMTFCITDLSKGAEPFVIETKQITRRGSPYDNDYWFDFVISRDEDGAKEVHMLVTVMPDYQDIDDNGFTSPSDCAVLYRTVLNDLKALLGYIVDDTHIWECRRQIQFIRNRLKTILFDVEHEAKLIRKALEE